MFFVRLSIALAAAMLSRPGFTQAPARFEVPRDTVLIDLMIPITLTGVGPGSLVTIRLAGHEADVLFTSAATFVADRDGRVELARAVPIAGSYSGADAMGLFWSTRRGETRANHPLGEREEARPNAPPHAAVPWQLTAETEAGVVATDTVWRRAVAAGVRVTRVRERGIVGVLYEPTGAERRPAVIALSGSNGGTPPAAEWPGGLASRGYVVLALAYFNEEGVPDQLANLPLEYFERALVWLGERPTVRANRIGVLGISRGGELALLLGATYPERIRAVVGYVPSSVLWRGCCDAASRRGSAWTLRGSPLPAMPVDTQIQSLPSGIPMRQTAIFLHRLSDTAAVARASIPVERIGGPVLLISGRADGMWPSFEMSEQVIARLRRHNFPHAYRHVSYEEAGHLILRPYSSTMHFNDNTHPMGGWRLDLGGTPAATARASEQAWADLLAFLERHLILPD